MQRLSGLDASFLYLETPEAPLHVAMAAVLDPAGIPGGWSFDRVVELLESRLHLLPPLRRRLVRVPLDLHHPLWVADPSFDIIHHVRRVTVPAPGGRRELGAMVGRITGVPLDRSRPLWEVWVLEGLKHGRVALVAKVHHAAVDGVTGAGLLVHLFDLERDGRRVPAPEPEPAERIPRDRELLRDAAAQRIRQPLTMLRLARRTAQAVGDVVRRRRDPDARQGATPLTAPRTPFNASINARRGAAFARVDLGAIKAVKRSLGTTVNDVVLAICAGALRRYLGARDALPAEPLIAAVPISIQPNATNAQSANKVSAMFTSLATHLGDPVQRLRAIQRVTRGAKEEHNAIGADLLQRWAELAAPSTFSLAARFYTRMRLADRHRPIHNLVISNVPGPPFPLYMAGAELVACYPLGPVIDGAGLNVTVMSYRGSVDFGFHVAADLLPDVWELADAVAPALEDLSAAARAAAPRAEEREDLGGE